MEEEATAKYKAPALAKGLEILELLSATQAPLTLSGISELLKRSRSEIFRMVQELEGRGYIARAQTGDGYELTNKLFLMGMSRPALTTLLDAALPIMRSFSVDTLQSCHLAVLSGTQFVVVARNEAPGPVTFSVRIGYRQSIARATSGIILYAMQPETVQAALLDELRRGDAPFDETEFLKAAGRARSAGYFTRESRFVRGVTDLGAPIARGETVAAALTAPCLTRIDNDDVKPLPVEELVGCARRISLLLNPASTAT